MRTGRVVLAVAVSVGALLLPVGASAGAAAGPVRLTVMSFNIWYGATQTHGMDQVVEAIRDAGADVVGMQEPYARLREVASRLGFHASPRLHVISRFPILEPAGSDGAWGYVLLAPGQVVAIANTHLSCCPYTPFRIVHHGFTRAEALQQERNTRLRQVEQHLTALEPLLATGVPTFFTGDFNAPSWRDWTPAAAEARGLPYAMRWPVSRAIEAAGFQDSYREIHPDPVADPGYTWTPGYPAPYVKPWDVFDRIDFVWASGAAAAERSRVIGESSANADLVVRPWPSDHRAVASTFSVTPSTPPVLVAAEGERARLGHPLRARFHAPGAAGEHVALVPAGSRVPIADEPTGGAVDGTVAFDTSALPQGTYDVVLSDAGDAELSRDTVVLVARDQKPVLTVADDTLEGDQELEVSWSFAPGNQFDWLAVYRPRVSAKEGPYKAWRYTDGLVEGALEIGPGSHGSWPLRPGRYEVRICLDDSYRCRSPAPFRVLG
jgi:endonuclease/exonuclease/phosphatase family metal-dependent hydrolase